MKCERAYVPTELAHVFGEHYRCLDRAKCAAARVESLRRRGNYVPPELEREAAGFIPKVRENFFESLQQMPEPLAAPAFAQVKPAKKPERSPWKKPAPQPDDAGEVVSADLLRSVDEMFGEIFEDKKAAPTSQEDEPVQLAAPVFVDDEVTAETAAYQEPVEALAPPAPPAPSAVKLKVTRSKPTSKAKPAAKAANTKKRGPKGETMLPQGKKQIMGRIEKQGKTYRQLSCGHEQKEPAGGKAHLAQSAFCQLCIQAEKAA